MTGYDFCLAWNWQHDSDFVGFLETACRSRGVSFLQITPDNLQSVLLALDKNRIVFRAFLDRASDADAGFLPVVSRAADRGLYCINPHEQASQVWDKASMHLKLIHAGLHTPYTIILSPYNQEPDLPALDLSPLGDSFTIKPAHGGGGEGVVTEAKSLRQIVQARKQYPDDKYLLQAHIFPAMLGARPAWFRIIYCAGQVYPCWWDTGSHIYSPVSSDEEDRCNLSPLHQIIFQLADLSRLDLFSTEIALSSENIFTVIDYVNDQIDLRLQSRATEGVPDEIVRQIAGKLVDLVADRLASADNFFQP